MLRIIKKLDIFVFKSYVLLFIGTFFICLFIFMMQFLWRYVDELIGKGLEFSVMAKFFYYSSLSLVATSLPLAILLASLITFGNFGERMELLAMKAAGISLIKVMQPLIIFTVLLCGASFYFQNIVTPNAQMKLYTLLISMRQKSPELDIPEGVFYDQIEGYNVYVKHKDRETGILYNVMIYNFSDGFDNAHIIVADSGKLEMTSDKQHLRLHLYSGEQFENLKAQASGFNQASVPYRRESFIEKHTIIEFDAGFNMANSDIFERDARSKDMHDLKVGADSISAVMDSIGHNFYIEARQGVLMTKISSADSIKVVREKLKPINVDSLLKISPKASRDQIYRGASQKVQAQLGDLMFKAGITEDGDRNIRKHKIEWLNKITLSLSCLIFFFIGAPLGAIIRKGGLGFPVVISVLIFIVYYIIDNTGMKMARNGTWPIWFGRWLSTMILAPTGAFITYKANNDSVVFNADAYMELFRKMLGLRVSRHIYRKEVIIQDPDYKAVMTELNMLCQKCINYSNEHKLAKAPNYFRIFTNHKQDAAMAGISNDLENIIEELSNSKEHRIVGMLNNYPYLMVNAHKSPFNNMWLNLLCGIIVPIGLFYYFRIWRFSRRLHKDLRTIVQNSQNIQMMIQTDIFDHPEKEETGNDDYSDEEDENDDEIYKE